MELIDYAQDPRFQPTRQKKWLKEGTLDQRIEAVNRGGLHLSYYINALQEDPSPVVRALVLEAVNREHTKFPKEVMKLALRDRSAIVRAAFFRIAANRSLDTLVLSLGVSDLDWEVRLSAVKHHVQRFSATQLAFALQDPVAQIAREARVYYWSTTKIGSKRKRVTIVADLPDL